MNRIQKIRRAAYRRMLVVGSIDRILVAGSVLLGAAVAARVGQQLELVGVDWNLFWIWGGAVCAVGAGAWIIMTRPDPARVSRMVDEAAGLPQSVSTVEWLGGRVGGQVGGWATAVREQAEAAVARIRVSQLFPLRAQRRWGMLPILGIAFLGVWLMPSYDLPGALMSDEQREERAQHDAIEEATIEVAEVEDELASALRDEDEDLAAMLDEAAREDDLPEAATPEDVRARAVRRMSKVGEELNERMENDEQMRQLEAMRDRLAQLRDRSSEDAGLKELSRALQRGDFNAASEALKKIEENLASMSEEQKEALAAEMKELAEQLAKLAEDTQALEDALSAAGLDPSLASDREALKKALEQMQGLTKEQREALMQMAQECDAASSMCKSMSMSMMQCQAGMCSGGNCSGAIGDMDAEFAKLALAQSKGEAMSQLQAKLALSMCKLGASSSMCKNPGIGGQKGSPYGSGDSEIEAAPDDAFTSKTSKAPSIDDGSTLVIGRSLIDAGQVRGESRQTFKDVMLAGGKAASRAMEDKQFPREYHDAVQAYFSSGATEQNDGTEASESSPE